MPADGPPDAIAPDGSLIHFRVRDARRASLVEVVLPAGAVSRPIRHRSVEEIWFGLEGEGEVWLERAGGGDRHPLAPGVTLVIPTGRAFQFRAGGGGRLRFLCYTSPPWPGDQEAEPVATGAWPLG